VQNLTIHPEVLEAIDADRAIVLLETAVVTAGLPRSSWAWPQREVIGELESEWDLEGPVNLELARAMSRRVRHSGGVPATTAIIDGRWHIGLDPEEVERLAMDTAAGKASVATAAVALQAGDSAGTTVSGALTVANLLHAAGLKRPRVLATGGIGGVHRGWATRPDVSADLGVIARTPVLVVSAGVKSIVDVPATGEWLETHGVPVLGYQTQAMPCFIAGVDEAAPPVHCVTSPQEAAAIAEVHWSSVNEHGGLLLGVPIDPNRALPRDEVESANLEAEAASSHRTGPARTPALLADMARRTDGRSLVANIALLLANADVATAVSTALANSKS
jgi:pseudouridine-5'-phosphate glycosidase